MQSIDAQAELATIRRLRETAQRQPYRRSRLMRYRAELVALRRAGASYPDLVVWLRTQHRVRVNHTTVMRYLKTLPELQEKHPDEHAG
jgi:hypothetical protein